MRAFRLDENQLEKFPALLFDLSRLEELRLDANRLREIPAGVGRLAALKTLKHVHGLWNRPVHIETREGGKPRLLSFEGEEAVIKEISPSAEPAKTVGSSGAAD